MKTKKKASKKDTKEKKATKESKEPKEAPVQKFLVPPEVAEKIKQVASEGKDKVKKAKDLIAKSEACDKFNKFKYISVSIENDAGDYWEVEDQELSKQLIDLAVKWHAEKSQVYRTEAEKIIEEIGV